MQTALRALRENIPEQWADWTEPGGGYLIWLKLNLDPGPTPDWEGLFLRHGIRAISGRRCFHRPPADHFLRLSISALDEEEIVEGVRRLACALAEVCGQN